MIEKPLVSVVIPAYNVINCLEECFTSIVEQTYSNLEIIIVDDGSTDGTSELCDLLVLRDLRSKTIHKTNAGVSSARNLGLKKSSGDWVCFIDADDLLSPIYVEALLTAAIKTGSKIARLPTGMYFSDKTSISLANDMSTVRKAVAYTDYEIQKKLLYQQIETGYQWHLFSRDILGLDPCPEDIYFAEDLASIYKIVRRSKTVTIIPNENLYGYRVNLNGLTRQHYQHNKGKSALVVSRDLYRDMLTWYPSLKTAASSRCFSLCRTVFAQIPRRGTSTNLFTRDKEVLWNELKKHRYVVLFDSQARKRERLAAFFASFGRHAFSFFCLFCRVLGKM